MKNDPRESKRIISRLILQKIISSEATKYMTKETHKKLNNDFLSSDPEKDKRFSLYVDSSKSSYNSEACTLDLCWQDKEGEVVDPEGNVWTSHELKMSANIGSTWGTGVEGFLKRIEIMNCLSRLIEEVNSVLKGPIQVLSLDNNERISRDEKRIYEKYCRELYEFFYKNNRQYIKGLRVMGSSRPFDHTLKVPAGRYEFLREEGTRRNPIVKKYVVDVPQTGISRVRRIS